MNLKYIFFTNYMCCKASRLSCSFLITHLLYWCCSQPLLWCNVAPNNCRMIVNSSQWKMLIWEVHVEVYAGLTEACRESSFILANGWQYICIHMTGVSRHKFFYHQKHHQSVFLVSTSSSSSYSSFSNSFIPYILIIYFFLGLPHFHLSGGSNFSTLFGCLLSDCWQSLSIIH
jgi:hypothetical protein